MINPITKAKMLGLSALATQIAATPNFNLVSFANSLPFTVANAKYGISQAQYNHLFIPNVSNLDGVCGPDQAVTATFSTGAHIASNINKFVAYIKTQF